MGALILANALAVAVVAILAMLVTTAGSLLATDWRADAASRQAWAEIDVAAAELRLPAKSVAPSLVDPRYLTATDDDALPSVFRTHHFASLAQVVESGTEASCATGIIAPASGPIPRVAAYEAAPRIARTISTAAASEVPLVRSPYQTARASLGLVVISCQTTRRVFRARTAAVTPRLVANGAWSQRLPHHRCVLTHTPPDRHVADIVVLSGDQCDRDQPYLPGLQSRSTTRQVAGARRRPMGSGRARQRP